MKEQKNRLDPDQRAAVIDETFGSITAIGFTKWRAEELIGHGNELDEQDLQDYVEMFEGRFFGEFQRMAAGASDEQLLSARDYWAAKAKEMTLDRWQEALLSEGGAAGWYDAVGREIESQFRPQRTSDPNQPAAPAPAPTEPPAQGADAVPLRPLTEQLVQAIMWDMWPGPAAVLDFGLDSQRRYEALYYPVRNGEITPEQLEAALGKGPELTRLANGAPSNPHKGIVFKTAWDNLLPEPNWDNPLPGAEPAPPPRGMKSLEGGRGPEPGPSPEQSRGSRRGR